MLNIPQNIFVGQLMNTQQGPVISTQVYDDKSLTYLDVYEWEVFNGARLVAPLPFGLFGQISQINMNKSRLQLRMAPGFMATPTAPVFAEVVEKDVNYDKYLSNATIIRKVVPPDFDLTTVPRENFWDIRLEPIDESHSMLVKVYADSPEVAGTETRRDLWASTPFTEEIVTAEEAAAEMAAGLNPNVEFTPVSVFHTLRREGVVPVAAMIAFNLNFPSRFSLDLPPVLKSLRAIWNSQYSIGTQDTQAYDQASGESWSLSMSIPDSASSAAAITAELIVIWEEFATNNLYTQTHIVYMPPPVTTATILAKVQTLYPGETISYWPVFRPRSETIVLTGQSVNVRSNVQVALHESHSPTNQQFGWTKSVSDDYSIGISNNTVQLPRCVHGDISIADSAPRSQPITATASMFITSSGGASVSATKTKYGTASGKVIPMSIAATGGQNSVPIGGYYIMDIDVKPYDYGWFQVRIEVFHASQLAPPVAPVGVLIVDGNNQVTISWQAFPNTTSYGVYRADSPGGPYTLRSTTSALNYIDTGLTNGTLYFYRIVANLTAGGSSAPSEIAIGEPRPPIPATPTGLAAVVGDKQLTLSWAASAGAVYYVLRRQLPGGEGETIIATITGLSFVDVGLTNGTTYYYTITATNVGGESPRSAIVSATPVYATPAAPVGVTAGPGNASVGLTWTVIPGIVEYRVKRHTVTGGPYTTVATVNVANYIDTGLTNGTQYFYVITAVNGTAESLPSLEVTATPVLPP